jgi:hypothetical protein
MNRIRGLPLAWHNSGTMGSGLDSLIIHVAKALSMPVSAFFAEQAGEAPALSEQERKLIEGFRGIKSREIRECFVAIIASAGKKRG